MSRVISFLSARDGYGKSSIIYAIATSLAGKGFRVCVFDSYFSLNHTSFKFSAKRVNDFKSYLNKSCGLGDVLCKQSENLFYLKTNSSTFDYLAHLNLIEKAIDKFKMVFDFVLIDVDHKNISVRDSLLGLSSECVLIMTPEVSSVVSTLKLIEFLKRFKNLTNLNVIINRLQVIKSLCNKALGEKDILKIMGRKPLFTLPKFIKNNPFVKNENEMCKDKFVRGLSESIIKNERVFVDYEKKYKGIVGFIKRKIYEKFE